MKKSEFSFYDLIYLNKNGRSITEDTLKILECIKKMNGKQKSFSYSQNAISLFKAKECMNESVPEYLYKNMMKKEGKITKFCLLLSNYLLFIISAL